MSIHTILVVGLVVLVWLVVLYGLRFTATKFKGKAFGKAASGLFKAILSVTPHIIANFISPKDG